MARESEYTLMEATLLKIGLPVTCRHCGEKGHVKPHGYDGWYKSKMFRFKRLKWYCPEHYQMGREIDNKFYENYKTPDPEPTVVADTVDELYALLD